MIMKKKIPLAIRQLLEQLMNEKEEKIFTPRFGEDSLFDLVDIDPNSGFFFRLEKQMISGNRSIAYVIEYKPSSVEHLNPLRLSVNFEDLKKHLKVWYNLLEQMNQESSVFDDPLLNSYYDELEPHFKILDDDADKAPFSIPQQKMIQLFLDRAEEVIQESNATEEEEKDIYDSIEDLKSSLSKSTKSEATKKFRKIIAKTFKIGLEVGEKLLVEFTAELTKKLMIG